MKKYTLLLVFMFVITGLNARSQDITLRFSANHTCSYAQLDSILVENLSQGGSTVLHYPDTILSLITTGIDAINANKSGFHVSQNYPNPFSGKTNIDIRVAERDVFNITVYDIRGLKLVSREITLDEGMHHFTFHACDKQSYILTVNGQNHSERQIMIQTVKSTGAIPDLTYQGSSFDNLTMDGSVEKDFDFDIGDELRFTGYAKGDHDIIIDAPDSDQDYTFEIAAEAPGQPSEILGETTVTPNETGLVYEVEADDALIYHWTVPTGWEITDGEGTHAITVNAGTESGEISVVAENDCGISPASVLLVTVEEPPVLYNLTLSVNPEEAGSVDGAGEYAEGEQVTILATAFEGFLFENWTDDNGNEIASSEAYTFNMSAMDLHYIANFILNPDGQFGDGVTDIDGNEYQTVFIGELEWMAENLRVSRYRDGTDIPSGFSETEWTDLSSGASAFFPPDMIPGLDTDEEVKEAYGKLYNWWAVEDSRGLCPAGWRVPTHQEWDDLKWHLVNNYDDIMSSNVGNALKDCRQLDSPIGGDCDTNEHPRWNFHPGHFGTDKYNFSALPGGGRSHLTGAFSFIGTHAHFWTLTEVGDNAYLHQINYNSGAIFNNTVDKRLGLSMRCVRDTLEISHDLTLIVNPEEGGQVTGDGTYFFGEEVSVVATANEDYEFESWSNQADEVVSTDSEYTFYMPNNDLILTANFTFVDSDPDGVTDIDGNEYPVVEIDGQWWMAANLRTTRYQDGSDIITGLSDSDWTDTTDGAYALYPHDGLPGIGSDEEMADAYGKLYNWYAIDDSRGLCPEGWRLPSNDEWTTFANYLTDNYDYSPSNVGNALKDCRQVNSPLGGDCDTSDHPRWNQHFSHHGSDAFSFSVLPTGVRAATNGAYTGVGAFGALWTSTPEGDNAWMRSFNHNGGTIVSNNMDKNFGMGVRCILDADD